MRRSPQFLFLSLIIWMFNSRDVIMIFTRDLFNTVNRFYSTVNRFLYLDRFNYNVDRFYTQIVVIL